MPKKSTARKANKESHSMQHRARKPGLGKGPGKESGSWQNIQGKSMAEGSKSKDGCFPKLFMMLLSLLPVGIYFLLKS